MRQRADPRMTDRIVEMADDLTLLRSAQKMRIAWLVCGDEQWGVAQAVRGLAQAVVGRGVEPVIVALRDGEFCELARKIGIPLKCLHADFPLVLSGGPGSRLLTLFRLALHNRRLVPQLVAALRETEADCLHFLWPNLMLLAGRSAKVLGIPCFWEMPNVMGRYPFSLNRRIVQRQLVRYAITPLANSQATAASLGDHPVKPELMYLGADPARFNPEAVVPFTRQEMGIPADATVLGIVARLVESKGQLVTLRAMASLLPQYPSLHLVLAGGADASAVATYLQSLDQAARKSGCRNHLHILGEVAEPERLYGAIDVPINAMQGAEPFGLSVVEAMMMGRPVLVHASGGPAETVVDGVTGWHIPEASEDSLREGILRALADRERWPEMGRAAHQRALEKFNIQRQADFYLAVLNKKIAAAKY